MRKGIYHLVKQIVVLFYYLMCNLCPVKQNRIVFDSSLGKSYSGNPKHIYEYLMANGYDLNWDCIWFYENEKYNIPGMSRQVRYGRLRYLYYMATAKVWVFDTRQPEFLLRRKGTYYIQTWHGTPLKKLALDMEDVFMVGESDIDSYKEHFTKNVHTWDFLISQNPFSSETFRRAFDFHREMLEYGYPRNDILFRENTTEGIRSFKRKLGLPEDKKIILYAPTWRDDEFSEDDKYEFRPQISFEKLQKELGDEYIMDENAKCRHQWLIEFAKMPDSVEKFAAILDATLKEVNSDYEAKRWKDIALQPLEVIVAREGLFHDWLAQRGKLGGQHKVPRLSNTREYIETMLALNDSILSEE